MNASWHKVKMVDGTKQDDNTVLPAKAKFKEVLKMSDDGAEGEVKGNTSSVEL